MNIFLIRWLARLLLIFGGFVGISGLALGQTEYLPPEEAFVWSASSPETMSGVAASGARRGRLTVSYTIAQGYYLYRDQFQFRIEPADAAHDLKVSAWPLAQSKFDATFNKTVAYYRGKVALPVEYSLSPHARSAVLVVRSQGCADAGLCYPPVEHRVALNAATRTGAGGVTGAESSFLPPWRTRGAESSMLSPSTTRLSAIDVAKIGLTNDEQLARRLANMSAAIVVLVFLGLGVLLSLTPCALPMVPIVLGILSGGQQSGARRWQGLRLSACYVLGMAAVYTVLGIAAGALGQGLAVFFQQPWIVGIFATLLCLLALPMFGIGSLQLSSRWQTRIASWSQRLPGGRATAAAGMGALSGLIVGPCVAPPLAGVLLFIAQTGNWLRGGTALFALAVGMGVPLLALGAGSGVVDIRRLARAGWLLAIKRVWGVLLLATAAWLVWPYIPSSVQGWVQRTLLSKIETDGTSSFIRIDSMAALDQALRNTTQPVMLDFYADWCVACHEMVNKTFNNADVRPLMQKFLRLQVDVTANNAEHQALLKRFKLFGPPGMVFFDSQGRLMPNARVVGFEPPARYVPLLRSVLAAAKQSTSSSTTP